MLQKCLIKFSFPGVIHIQKWQSNIEIRIKNSTLAICALMFSKSYWLLIESVICIFDTDFKCNKIFKKYSRRTSILPERILFFWIQVFSNRLDSHFPWNIYTQRESISFSLKSLISNPLIKWSVNYKTADLSFIKGKSRDAAELVPLLIITIAIYL